MASSSSTLFPKYTTFVGTAGGTSYYTPSFEVGDYANVHVNVMLEAATAGSTVTVQLEESPDNENWSGVGSADTLTAGTLTTVSKSDPDQPYLRFYIKVTGADDVATAWAELFMKD